MPDRPVPRLLTRAALRAYLGDMPWGEIVDRIQDGRLPTPVYGVKHTDKAARWDIRAVDRALDAASALPNSIEAGTAILDRALGLS